MSRSVHSPDQRGCNSDQCVCAHGFFYLFIFFFYGINSYGSFRCRENKCCFENLWSKSCVANWHFVFVLASDLKSSICGNIAQVGKSGLGLVFLNSGQVKLDLGLFG